MDISLLPSGTRCLVDANILIYHIAGSSLQCKDFLQRVAGEEVEAYLTTTIIAEVLHRQMLIEALAKGLVTPGKAIQKLKSNPLVVSSLVAHISEVEKLLLLPFTIIEVTAADLTSSHSLRLTYGLFVNDSISLACAQRFGITDVVTHDADFSRIGSINVWEPLDI